MKYFIDTNIFLRTLIPGDEKQHQECFSLLTLIKQNKLDAYTNSVVLAEIAWTLGSYYQFTKKKVIKAVRSIVNLRGLFIVDSYDHTYSLKLYETHSAKYIDTLISSDSHIRSKLATVISYDHDFNTLPLSVLEPSHLLRTFSGTIK